MNNFNPSLPFIKIEIIHSVRKIRFWCKKSGYFTKLMKSFTIEKVNQNVTKEIGTKK